MTAEQLEELLGKVTQGEWSVRAASSEIYDRDHGTLTQSIVADRFTLIGALYSKGADAALIALAPSLARRVIAAEKLAKCIDTLLYDLTGGKDVVDLAPVEDARAAYREASK